MKFSILIPVYNTESYVGQCIESVLSQDCTDYEMILVNDGSTDRSAEICEGYAAKDPRIKYFSKQNEGLLLTRRYSLQRASGEYVLFLDSDDYWDRKLLSTVDAAIQKTRADIITYRFSRIRDNGKKIFDDVNVFPENRLFDGETKNEFIDRFVSSSRLNQMWIKCVRRSIIDIDTDYSGFKDKKGEDLLQSVALLRNASSIYYINDVLYYYRLSPSGRGRNFRESYLTDYETVRSYVFCNLKEMNVPNEILHHFLIRYIEGMMSYVGMIAQMSDSGIVFAQIMNRICRFPTYMEASANVRTDELKKDRRADYRSLKNGRFARLYRKYLVKNKVKKIITHFYKEG